MWLKRKSTKRIQKVPPTRQGRSALCHVGGCRIEKKLRSAAPIRVAFVSAPPSPVHLASRPYTSKEEQYRSYKAADYGRPEQQRANQKCTARRFPLTPNYAIDDSNMFRQACLQCQKRKKRCDGGKPSCANCSKFNASCQYKERRPRGPGKK